MKRAMVLALVVALAPVAVAAQGRQGQGARRPLMGQGRVNPAQAVIERQSQLGLTEEQVAKLGELAKQWDENHEALRTQMGALREERQQLTDEQQQQMRTLREQMMESGRSVQEGIRGTLTEEQRQQLGRGLAARGMRGGAMPGRTGRGRRGGGGGPGAIAPRRPIGPRGPGAVRSPAVLNRAGPGPRVAPRVAALARRAPAVRGRVVLRFNAPLSNRAPAVPLRRRVRIGRI